LPARPEAAVVPSPPASGEDFTPDQYLNRAREEYDAGRVAAALGFLDQFREQYPAGSDESWWLYGQFLEAGSPSRDIRSALDYYRRLIREYPQSSRYDDARRRISYLERYYFNIP
jgi:outer membrane protein assembly factor BamD (BamD/ComL family)